MEIEKRKNIRFLVQDNVILALKNGFNRVGRVRDISMGGLSFEHIHEEDLKRIASICYLFLWVDDFNISQLPCRIIYDILMPIPPEYDLFVLQLVSKRCGVEFETLTESQITRLEVFLKTYTKGRVE